MHAAFARQRASSLAVTDSRESSNARPNLKSRIEPVAPGLSRIGVFSAGLLDLRGRSPAVPAWRAARTSQGQTTLDRRRRHSPRHHRQRRRLRSLQLEQPGRPRRLPRHSLPTRRRDPRHPMNGSLGAGWPRQQLPGQLDRACVDLPALPGNRPGCRGNERRPRPRAGDGLVPRTRRQRRISALQGAPTVIRRPSGRKTVDLSSCVLSVALAAWTPRHAASCFARERLAAPGQHPDSMLNLRLLGWCCG